MKKYSVIVPVYNRPQEVKELLDSLVQQTLMNFELVLVEDGSSEPCEYLLENYSSVIPIRYFFKPNTGPGDSRNFGMSKAEGEYFIFFDSDCIIPPDYFQQLTAQLAIRELDAFGGPDAAHPSFSDVQKAINYAMTSFITTGGIRGKKIQLDQFQPRSFNMGIKNEVYRKVGGFSDIHPGEDPDLSYRIMDAGYSTGLVPEAFVYHKRRIDFGKFRTQVSKFGMTRVILMKWYPSRTKAVYFLPALFTLGCIALMIGSILSLFLLNGLWALLFLAPFALLTLLLWTDALIKTKSLKISFLSVAASYTQLLCYGWGFIKAYAKLVIGKKEPREAFPRLFFSKTK